MKKMKNKKVRKLIIKAKKAMVDLLICYHKQKQFNLELVEENEKLKEEIQNYERRLNNTFKPAEDNTAE